MKQPAPLHTSRLLIAVFVSVCLGMLATVFSAEAQTGKQIPTFQVDPSWPQLPETWILGASAGIAADSSGNVWFIHRPGSVTEKKACCRPAPVVMQFDPAGKLLQSWNGAGEGYQWPMENDEHGIYVDYKNNVWIAGRGANGASENQILKFDSKGKFLLQIGRRGTGNNSNDTERLGQPADMAVYPQTNEVFVADGYGNRRVIVFDADTGVYKRHWGAYGNRPDDAGPKNPHHQGPGDPQFNQVHHLRISNDGLVYVADRLNRRIQVFRADGTFVKETFVRRDSKESAGTVSSFAFSADPQQRFLYVADQTENQILILDRQTFEELGTVGRLGRYAGQFVSPHNIATDAQGNLYVGEDVGGQRVQKFAFKGLAAYSSVAAGASSAAAEVLAFERDMEAAVVRGDVAFVERVSAPDLSFTHGDAWTTGGKPLGVDNRQSFLERVRNKHYNVRDLDSVKVEMHGDIAITYGRYVAQNRVTVPGKDAWFSVWFERVYQKRDGHWLYVSHRTVHGPTYGPDRRSVSDK